MGHVILHREFGDKTPERQMTDEVLNIVNNSGDGYGTESVKYHSGTVFECRDDAEKWIDQHDQGFYQGIAVRFYDYSRSNDTKKMERLQERIQENVKKAAEYAATHSVKKLKAAYIGCPICGSKLNKEKLRGEKCPLCYAELRSVTVLARLEKFEDNRQALIAQYEAEQRKDKKNATIKWLVKFEYHC